MEAGFTQPRGGKLGFGAIVLGLYERGRFIYIGRTGGGLTGNEIADLCQSTNRAVDTAHSA